jgi:fucose 4-O-acetylase-like acetyltransferase
MLKVDILNIMGPLMIAAAALWALGRGPRRRAALFAATAVAVVLITPPVRHLAGLAALPDSLEGYLRPIPGLTNFTLFPWAAFVMAGAVVGVILDSAQAPDADRRANLALGVAGVLLAAGAYRASFLPPLHSGSAFWTTSTSFFFLRLGLMIVALTLAWLWEQRRTAGRRWSPIQLMGRTSLFLYWIHVELVYGLLSHPLHGAFSLRVSWAALVAFCGLMLWVAVLKERLVPKYLVKGHLREKLNRQLQTLMF